MSSSLVAYCSRLQIRKAPPYQALLPQLLYQSHFHTMRVLSEIVQPLLLPLLLLLLV
jgi:hypothetical protein